MRKLALGFIAAGMLLAITAVMKSSVTVDEYQAVPSGIAMWQTGDFKYPQGTPPLSQLVPAFPLYVSGARIEPQEGSSPNWAVAHAFADKYKVEFQSSFTIARITCAFVFLLLMLAIYFYSMELYGEAGAAIAVFCTAFNPNLLAHGVLATPDIFLAAGVVFFLLALHRIRENPSVARAGILGVCLGVSILSKFTALLFVPFVPLWLWADKEKWKHIGITFAVAFLLIHCGYFLHGSFAPAGSYFFQSGIFQKVFSIFPGWLPIPFPSAFLHAMDWQLSEPPYPAYLLGQSNGTGFFSYYLVALLVKTPLALLLLGVAASLLGRPAKRERPIVFILLAFFLFFTFARYKNIGIRYLLFLYPLLAVWIGRMGTYALSKRKRAFVFAAGASIFAGALFSWPHYLSYFNLPSGGTQFGYHYLLDSNLDWGQELPALANYQREKNIPEFQLSHFGHVDPALYGIRYKKLKAPAEPGYVAISANFLYGMPYFQNGLPEMPASMEFLASFRNREPEAVLGGAIYVYKVE